MACTSLTAALSSASSAACPSRTAAGTDFCARPSSRSQRQPGAAPAGNSTSAVCSPSRRRSRPGASSPKAGTEISSSSAGVIPSRSATAASAFSTAFREEGCFTTSRSRASWATASGPGSRPSTWRPALPAFALRCPTCGILRKALCTTSATGRASPGSSSTRVHQSSPLSTSALASSSGRALPEVTCGSQAWSERTVSSRPTRSIRDAASFSHFAEGREPVALRACASSASHAAPRSGSASARRDAAAASAQGSPAFRPPGARSPISSPILCCSRRDQAAW
jgi:hypothetical protein